MGVPHPFRGFIAKWVGKHEDRQSLVSSARWGAPRSLALGDPGKHERRQPLSDKQSEGGTICGCVSVAHSPTDYRAPSLRFLFVARVGNHSLELSQHRVPHLRRSFIAVKVGYFYLQLFTTSPGSFQAWPLFIDRVCLNSLKSPRAKLSHASRWSMPNGGIQVSTLIRH